MNIKKFEALTQAELHLASLAENTVLTMALLGPIDVAIRIPKMVVVDFFNKLDPRDFHGVKFIDFGNYVHVGFILGGTADKTKCYHWGYEVDCAHTDWVNSRQDMYELHRRQW